MSPVEDEQGPLVGGPEVRDIYSVGTECRTSDDWTKSGRTDGFRCSDDPGNICVCIRKEVGSGSGCCGGISGEAGDSTGETCDTQTQQCFIGE